MGIRKLHSKKRHKQFVFKSHGSNWKMEFFSGELPIFDADLDTPAAVIIKPSSLIVKPHMTILGLGPKEH